MLRVIREVQPTWVVGENVYGLVNWNDGLVFEEVSVDLENEGYEVQPYILPAVSVGAVHRRDRVWFVARRNVTNTDSNRGTQFGKSIKSEGEARNLKEQGEWVEHSKQPNELFGLQRNASNPNSIGCDNGSDNRKERHIQGNERIAKKNKSERNGWECGVGKACSAQTESFANTDSNGCDQRNSEHEVKSDERGEYAQRDIDKSNEYGDSSNSDNEGLERETSKRIQTGKRRRNRVYDGEFAWMGSEADWFKFPTQSPVCNGNDGIPDRMVDITIPRWRKESVMSLGNAIVPQVAIQLFKTIQQYNSITSSS